MASPSLEQVVDPFRFLCGHWQGRGAGRWDPGEGFEYREDLRLELIPDRALIRIALSTFEVSSGALSHSEQGYLRLFPEGEAELVLAIPAGYTEVHQGQVEGQSLQFKLLHLGLAPRARPLSATRRSLELRGGRLRHQIDIAVGAGEPVAHVASTLDRVGE
ncbi:MAG: heme-binding beta-barrel domain-containing protein [Candidatus Dormibacteria bacterium]